MAGTSFEIDVMMGGKSVGRITVNSIEIAMSDGAGGTIVFAPYNLGADTTLDPDIPVKGIHGNYYQWGRKAPVASAYTPSGSIAGWDTTYAPLSSWLDDSKTVNDQYPAGQRIPTKEQWVAVITCNSCVVTGATPWSDNPAIFNRAGHVQNGSSQLTLPARGVIFGSDGSLRYRGQLGFF